MFYVSALFLLEILLSGIGYTLDPDFSFVKIAAPYAQVPYIFLTIIIYQLVHNNFLFACLELYHWYDYAMCRNS